MLRRVSDRFHIARNPGNPYKEGNVYYKRGETEANCGACEWGPMPLETKFETDEVNPLKKAYQRRSWPHVLRNICGNDQVPIGVRRRLFSLAEKEGFRKFLSPDRPQHRDLWLQMRGL
jgi:hypothetical protein